MQKVDHNVINNMVLIKIYFLTARTLKTIYTSTYSCNLGCSDTKFLLYGKH